MMTHLKSVKTFRIPTTPPKRFSEDYFNDLEWSGLVTHKERVNLEEEIYEHYKEEA